AVSRIIERNDSVRRMRRRRVVGKAMKKSRGELRTALENPILTEPKSEDCAKNAAWPPGRASLLKSDADHRPGVTGMLFPNSPNKFDERPDTSVTGIETRYFCMRYEIDRLRGA